MQVCDFCPEHKKYYIVKVKLNIWAVDKIMTIIFVYGGSYVEKMGVSDS